VVRDLPVNAQDAYASDTFLLLNISYCFTIEYFSTNKMLADFCMVFQDFRDMIMNIKSNDRNEESTEKYQIPGACWERDEIGELNSSSVNFPLSHLKSSEKVSTMVIGLTK